MFGVTPQYSNSSPSKVLLVKANLIKIVYRIYFNDKASIGAAEWILSLFLVAMSSIYWWIRFYKSDNSGGIWLMSGDSLIEAQTFKFYSEEMTETKWIALAHLEKELLPISNSLIYLDQKRE